MASRSILRPTALVGRSSIRCISAARRYASQQAYEYLLVSNPKPGVALCIYFGPPPLSHISRDEKLTQGNSNIEPTQSIQRDELELYEGDK